MHLKRWRLTARCTGNDHFLNELPNDADQGLLGLGISVIAHHVKHGVYHRADCVFVDLVAQICEAFCIADWLVHRRRACQLPLQFFSFFIEPVELVVEGRDYRRPVWLFRSSRMSAERAFDREIGELVARSDGTVRDVRVLGAPDVGDEGLFDAAGRIDMPLLKTHLPFGDYDFYLCGPPSYMQSMYDGLRGLNVPDNRIHAEAFGSSSLKRDPTIRLSTRPAKPAARAPTRVVFTQSGKEAIWKPGDGSLLELAEQCGLSPTYTNRH